MTFLRKAGTIQNICIDILFFYHKNLKLFCIYTKKGASNVINYIFTYANVMLNLYILLC